MELDFSKLNGLYSANALEAHQKAPERQEKRESVPTLPTPTEAHTGQKQPHTGDIVNGIALKKLTREQENHSRTAEMYKAYQQNIRKSSQIQTEILKGLKAREATPLLLLKALKAISLMTDNELFYKQAEKDLKEIYGETMLEPLPIRWELSEVEARLERLEAALEIEEQPDSKERIKKAIEEHRKRKTQLEELLALADRL